MRVVSRLTILAVSVSFPSLAQAEISDAFAAMVTPPAAEAPIDGTALASVSLLDRKQSYVIVAQPVQRFLELVASEAGVRLKVSDKVKGTVRNLKIEGSTQDVLDAVAVQNGLDWFLFNGIVYVSARSEATTRLLKLKNLSHDRAMAALTDAGLPKAEFDAHATSSGSVLAISGPPELLAIAEAVIESVPSLSGPSRKRSPEMVLVRRGDAQSLEPLRNRSGATYEDK